MYKCLMRLCGVWRIAVVSLFSLLMACVIVFLAITSRTREFTDTEYYFTIAERVSDIRSLFYAARPALITIFFKAFLHNDSAIVAIQTAVYVVAWTFLIHTLVMGVRWLSAAILLAACAAYFAVYPEFSLWNKTILSDSPSISLSVVAFAFLLRWIDSKRDVDLAGMLASLVADTYVRDFNAYYALFFLALAFVLFCLRITDWRRLAFVTAILVGNFFIAAHAGDRAEPIYATDRGPVENTGPRWYFAMLNNVGMRVLANSEALDFFSAKGMPVSPALTKMTNKWAHEENWAFFTDPDLQQFRRWLREDGVKTYASYLAHHPVSAVLSMVPRVDDLFHHNHFAVGYYIAQGYKAHLVPRIEHKYIYVLNTLLIGLMFAAAIWQRSYELTGYAALALVFFASVLPLAFIAFHAGSDMEVARHSLSVPLQNVFALIFNGYLLFTKVLGAIEPPRIRML
jgi:hypothetical protein